MSRRRARPPHQPVKKASRWPSWNDSRVLGLLLVLLTLVAYAQTWHNGFIWDDDSYVTNNPTLRTLHGLWQIWSDVVATPQYYPLVFTSFWLEYHFWGLNPLGYHLVNVFLHALSAVLLWRILTRLEIPGAWLAAAIFAVHPIAVESVAWITERKNVLSAVFYFAAALTYLRFEAIQDAGNSGRRHWRLYLISLAFFVFALLSKTVTCSLPAALLLVHWWKTGRLKRQEVARLLPFFVIGLALGLLTAWLEKHHVRAEGEEWSFTFVQRFLIAGRALWFYASKLFWPAKLTFIYPHWDVSVSSVGQWVFPLSALVAVVSLWWTRTRIGRGPLVAVLFFAGTLFPALGFINVFPFRYSFVADHFQYLASVGLIVLAAAGLARVPRFIPAAVLVVLAALTWRQVSVYRDLDSLWSDTVNKNPASWMAQNNFGMVLQRKGKEDEAIAHFQQALKLDSSKFEIYNNLGHSLTVKGRLNESLLHLRKALEINPNYAEVRYNLGHALLRAGLLDDAIVHLKKAVEINPNFVPAYSDLGNALLWKGELEESLAYLQRALEIDPNYKPTQFNLANTLLQSGRGAEAVAHLQKVLSLSPDDAEAEKNMAWVLATSPDAGIRDGAKAVELAERANRSTGGQNPIIAITLAAAYAEAGRFPDAIQTAEEALRLANNSGNVALAEGIRGYIQLYRLEHPFRDIR